MKTLATSSLAVFLLAGSALGQSINWTNPAGGLWNVPGNWAGGNVPSTITESAIFNLGSAYTATLDISIADLDSVSMLDTMGTLNFNSGTFMGVNGSIVNNGAIVINPTNGGFSTTLNMRTSNSISGSGTLTLGGASTRAGLSSTGTTTHGSTHTINGLGRIIGDFINNGTIQSNFTGSTLDIMTGTWINNNRVEVINGSVMDFNNLDITQNPTAEIAVTDGQLNLTNSSITNGTISSQPGFHWTQSSGTSTIDSVRLTGEGHINTGTALKFFNTIENDGVLRLNPTNGGFSTSLEAQNNATLDGNGSLVMGGVSTRAILRTLDPGQPITNASTHTIQGIGTIQAPLTNQGLVIADVAGQILTLNTNNKINNKIFRVSNGATLAVTSVTIDQTGGGQINLDDGSLTFSSATILGGSITPGSGTGTFVSGTSFFDGVTSNAPLIANTGTTLVVSNGMVNNGTLSINPTNGGFASILRFMDSSTLSGSGDTIFGGIGVRAQLNTDPDQTMTVAPDHTIRGFGQINASMINNGTIIADVDATSLLFRTEIKINNGLITAEPGATLDLNNVEIQQSASGEIDVADGSMALTTATIRGGTINADSGLVTHASGTNRLDSVVLNAPMNMNSGSTTIIENGLESNNTITVNPTNGGFATSLNFRDSMTLEGTGNIHLASANHRSQLNTDAGQTVTINPDYTIHGIGQINASLINNGTIDADASSGTLDFRGSDKTNNALISIQPGATLSMQGMNVDQSGTGMILINDGLLNLATTTITGGTIDAISTGSTTVSSNSSMQDLINNTPVNVISGSQLRVEGTVTNNNEIQINPTNGGFGTTLHSTAPAIIDGTGDLILGGSTSRSQITGVGMTLGADQTLRGIGQINAPLTIHGTIAPGLSVGEMDASQPITLTNTSTYEVEVSNFNVNDVIDSSSTFHADGTLDLSLIDGFNPTTAWVATIVTADAGVTGTFDTIIAPPTPLDPRLSFKIGYFDNEIRVGAVCNTDFDFSGSLNFLDVSMYLSLYGMMDPITDMNSDGSFNFLDISLFLSSYGQSCP
tara:strand:+ start:380340 stop:383486 length:3147 start_codon:yes stop_codon:yes gene_type:complete